jgi:hypothetical protein
MHVISCDGAVSDSRHISGCVVVAFGFAPRHSPASIQLDPKTDMICFYMFLVCGHGVSSKMGQA